MQLLLTMMMIAGVLVQPSESSTDTFIYVGCTQTKYTPATLYETNLNTLLTTLMTAASTTSFTNLTVSSIHGLYQCRPNLLPSDCAQCVSNSLSQLNILCPNSVGAALQLDGCFLRYDNVSFFGVEDKTVVMKKCGAQISEPDELTRRDSVLGYLASGRELFRVGGSGDVSGVADCVGDLTVGQCQDCLTDAIGRLTTYCGSASWGDVFLAKCYARYSVGGTHAPGQSGSSNDDETEKTLAIIIGLIAVVALITIFAAFLRKSCEEKGGK